MSEQGKFLIYGVETYKNDKHLTGKQVSAVQPGTWWITHSA